MPTGSGASPNVVKTALDEVLFGEYEAAVAAGTGHASTADLFKISGIENQAAIEEEFAGPGKWLTREELGDVEEDEILTGNNTTHSVTEWNKDLPVPRTFYDDAMHGVVNRAVAEMGRQARNSQDDNALGVYVGGFATYTTPDAAYIWSDSHTNLNGDTIDNLETGSLTVANLETLMNSLYLQKDQRGRLGGHEPAALLVAPAIFPDAQEITKSELQANTTDNNLNYFSNIYPGLRVYRSPWISSTYNTYTNANTSYYLVSKNHFIRRRIREELNTVLVPWQYDPKRRYQYRGAFREVVYAATWEGGAASNGSA